VQTVGAGTTAIVVEPVDTRIIVVGVVELTPAIVVVDMTAIGVVVAEVSSPTAVVVDTVATRACSWKFCRPAA
jgi:hypothetical protein